MQKNWYVVYTKPHFEKKVTSLLTKRKIENFCAYNRKQVRHLGKNKLVLEPLFDSYVFVKIVENDISVVKKIDNVINLLYWKDRPAVVDENEIQAIKEFTADHFDIKLERSRINLKGKPGNIDATSYTLDGKILIYKNRTFNVYLPSIGLTLMAEMEIQSISQREHSVDNKKLLLQ
jgi:transcription antitermination factor NusG